MEYHNPYKYRKSFEFPYPSFQYSLHGKMYLLLTDYMVLTDASSLKFPLSNQTETHNLADQFCQYPISLTHLLHQPVAVLSCLNQLLQQYKTRTVNSNILLFVYNPLSFFRGTGMLHQSGFFHFINMVSHSSY